MNVESNTLKLLKCLLGRRQYDACKKLSKLARLNKVYLQFLEACFPESREYAVELGRYMRALRTAVLVARELDGLEYALFKFLRPVKYVPADVDFLVSSDCLVDAVKRLVSSGKFKIVDVDKYTVSLVGNGYIIDLYTHPSVGDMIFLDGEKLLRYRTTTYILGERVQTLDPCIDALVVAAHAVYKEHILTLNDVITFVTNSSENMWELAKELKCEDALKLVTCITASLLKGLVELPLKLGTASARVLLNKLFRDSLTRSTALNPIRRVLSTRGVFQLRSKITRTSY